MFDLSTTVEDRRSHNLQGMQNYGNLFIISLSHIFIQNFLFIQGHPKYLLETGKHLSDTSEPTEEEVHCDIHGTQVFDCS